MGGRGNKPTEPLVEPLTRREREILALLEQDLSNQEIAGKLTLAVSSTKWHIQQIYGKLGVNNRRQALARARELGLLQPESPVPSAVGALEPRPGRPLPTGTVTFLFTDIEGSTPLWEREPEKMSAALLIHHAALRRAIEANGGVVFKTVGDALQAAFPTAPQALKAALQGQRELQSAPWNEMGPLRVRMGLHTGEAELDPGGDEYAVSHTKNRAARVMSAGHGGQVLLSAEAAELCAHSMPAGVRLKDLGEHHLKGLAQPEHLFQALAPGLQEDFPPLATHPGPKHNLPRQLTGFIGREAEISQVKLLLETHPLVTLTGSGGVGKTRLSIQVAEEVLERFPDGVWFVDLAPLSDPGLVAQTIASGLGLREEPGRSILETLTGFLGGKQALLVLDNCEHLVDACARLVDILLHSCVKLKLLASSREVLGVQGENTFRVPSMGFPGIQQIPTWEAFQEYDAIRLFVERAQTVLPAFEITNHNALAVIEVCHRLDGIPLAIELAAARVNLLRVEQIASRLEENFSLLVSSSRTAIPRHKTLQATIDWSFNLLSEQERSLLRRLSVFAGGCTLEAVEAVCAREGLERGEILNLLASLVNKSMLIAERRQGFETRYSLLDTVYRYAREKLAEAGESKAFQNQHLKTFLDFAETAEIQMYTVRLAEWVPRVKAELDNLRAAIQWSYGPGANPQAGLRISTALARRFMPIIGNFEEARQWLLSGIEKIGILPETGVLRARSFSVLGWLALNVADWPPARRWYDDSIQLCREVGSAANAELTWALWGSSFILYYGYHDIIGAKPLAKESVAVAHRLGTSIAEQLSLVIALSEKPLIITGNQLEEELAAAQREAEESLLLQQQTGIYWNAPAYWTLAHIAEIRGDYRLAYEYYQNALAISKAEEARPGIANSYVGLSWLSYRQGNYANALLEIGEFIREWYAMGSHVRTVDGLISTGIFLSYYADRLYPEEKKRKFHQAVVLLSSASKVTGNSHDVTFSGADLSHSGTQDDINRALGILGNNFGIEEFEQAWSEGQAMTLDEAVKFAFSIRLDDE